MAEPTRHLEDGRLLAHLDGELPPDEDRRVAEHLEACRPCRRRAGELREMSELLRSELPRVDVHAPDRDPAEVRPIRTDVRRGRLARRSVLKAALVVLGVATAAAAVVPGSPLRDWLVDAAGRLPLGPASDTAVTAPAPARPDPETVALPVDDRALVQLTDPGPGLVVRVRVTDRPRLTVTARAARYETGSGSVEVASPRGPEVVVELPRAVPSARISADRRLLLEKERGRIWVHDGADTTETGYVLHPGADRDDLLE